MILTDNPKIFSLGENRHTTDYEVILDLGDQPWGNNFLEKDEVGSEPRYPLKLVYCNMSELLQLTYFVPKEVMFTDHTYLSGTTRSLTDHFYSLAEENVRDFKLTKKDTILDIGGNDGTQLQQYKTLGITKLINVESATNIAAVSKQNDIPVLNMFFNQENIKKNLKRGSVKLINASGIFFHMEELDSAIKGIKYALNANGVFVVQFMYVGSMIDNGNFDTVYHEHLCYYTVNSISKLLERHKLKLFDAQYSDVHSGTIIARFCKQSCKKYPMTERCRTRIVQDHVYGIEEFKQFGKKIEAKRDDLADLLTNLKKDGKTIYGYGAPVKGNTLLSYMNIDNTIIDKIVEANELKIGKFTPGTHIPIVEETSDDLPDYYLLLCHNFKDEILAKNKHIMEKGVKFIIPFPEIEII